MLELIELIVNKSAEKKKVIFMSIMRNYSIANYILCKYIKFKEMKKGIKNPLYEKCMSLICKDQRDITVFCVFRSSFLVAPGWCF